MPGVTFGASRPTTVTPWYRVQSVLSFNIHLKTKPPEIKLLCDSFPDFYRGWLPRLLLRHILFEPAVSALLHYSPERIWRRRSQLSSNDGDIVPAPRSQGSLQQHVQLFPETGSTVETLYDGRFGDPIVKAIG